jgi:hypothetical protein
LILTTLRLGRERREVLGASTLQQRWSSRAELVFASPYLTTVVWGANGAGKSKILAEIVRRYLGRQHAWQVHERTPPVCVLAGNTWGQLSQTLAYLWEGMDRRWLGDDIRFAGGQVRGQRLAIYDLKHGPGVGGQLRLGTFDAENLAGPRAGLVVTDEPLPRKVYDELVTRGFGRGKGGAGARIVVGYTPTISNCHDVDYLWDMVKSPACPWAGEVQLPLDLETVTPRGGLVERPWMSAEGIELNEAKLTGSIEKEMRMGRARHPEAGARFFDNWRSHLITSKTLAELTGWRLAVGVDHGSKPGAQVAVLVAVYGSGLHGRAHVLGEYLGGTEGGSSTPREDGVGIVQMLRRCGVRVEQVDLWIGDRSHENRAKAVYKSNDRLKAAIAEALGISTSLPQWSTKLPKELAYMRVPRKYARSAYEGADVINGLMRAGALTVDPSCVQLIHAIERWEGGHREPHKDKLDAMRYPVQQLLSERR